MAIIDKTGQAETITTGWRALQLFTDRYQAIRRFAAYLNDDPPRKHILFFHGDGGNGKSLLLRELQEHYCKRFLPEDWEWIGSKDDEEFSRHIKLAEDAKLVPSALLDFGMPPRGDDRPQEAFSALLMLRRALAGHGLSFPLYGFACIWYLRKTGKLTSERLREIFPAEEMDLITEIVNAFSQTPWAALGKVVLNIFSKYLSLRQGFTLYMHRRRLDEGQVEAIQRMDPESELMEELPRLFAEDLNAALMLHGAPKRVVLFFDTHEAFWGAKERTLSGDLFFQRDEWLRRLLGRLELKEGIVAVVAGRELPLWGKASKFMIPDEFLDPQLVGHLSEPDAAMYLECAGITNEPMRQCLINHAKIAPNQIHPLYLGLCADVVLAASARGMVLTPEDFRIEPQVENKGKELIDRLLRYVDVEVSFAIRALSASRAFDRKIYLKLGEELHFQATEPAFRTLTNFSFVWRAESHGEGWYRIHDLLRRLFREHNEEEARRADELLERYYRESSQAGAMAAFAEAIYHANRLDWRRGINEWVATFDLAREASYYEFCRALLEVRGELFVEAPFEVGEVSRREGDYFAILARYDEATQKFSEAVSAYDEALSRAPDDVAAYNNKGIALRKLAALYTALSQYPEAIDYNTQALAAYDKALERAPDDVAAYNNKGITLQGLGELQAKHSQYVEAIDYYTQALAAYDKALEQAPDHPDHVAAHHNKGLALRNLGELHTLRSEYSEAIICYAQALAAHDEVLSRAPDDVASHDSKGLVLSNLAALYAALSQYSEAIICYAQALAAHDEALSRAPDYVAVHVNKGFTLRHWGELYAASSQYSEAIDCYTQALAAYDKALEQAPDHVAAYDNKALALRDLGELQAKHSQYVEAIDYYTQALAAHDKALEWAPNDAAIRTNKGITLARRASSYAKLLRYSEAINSLEAAVEEFAHASEIAPSNNSLRNVRDQLEEWLNQLRGHHDGR